jgi:hypothetical protein
MQIGEPFVSQRPWCGWLAAIGPIFRERYSALGTLADVEPFTTTATFEQDSQPSLRKRMEWVGYNNRIRISAG